MSKNTLFDKIWDAHIVQQIEDGPTQLYIDRMYCHEVTSPQAFAGMKERGLKCFRPANIICMPDHNTPTCNQDRPIEDPTSRKQVETLKENAEAKISKKDTIASDAFDTMIKAESTRKTIDTSGTALRVKRLMLPIPPSTIRPHKTARIHPVTMGGTPYCRRMATAAEFACITHPEPREEQMQSTQNTCAMRFLPRPL